MFYGHSAEGRPRSEWQLLSEHLGNVSSRAAQFGAAIGFERAARLAGLLHDLGKYTLPFQARLEGGEPVDHSTAGAKMVRELAPSGFDAVIAELIAYGSADRNFSDCARSRYFIRRSPHGSADRNSRG
ncbi:MAG: CRISPR-associated endonuclease Cas3'' [Pararhizobium sp.]